MNFLPTIFLSRSLPSYAVVSRANVARIWNHIERCILSFQKSSSMCAVRYYSAAGNETKFPKNVIEHLNTAQEQQTNGVIYDKKPFRMELEEGKRYSWCLCGRSKGQPLCDGTHKLVQYKITQRYVMRRPHISSRNLFGFKWKNPAHIGCATANKRNTGPFAMERTSVKKCKKQLANRRKMVTHSQLILLLASNFAPKWRLNL
uniref:Iron-binding zinc finger CDGSH type domain-containing protein n=1 Tax=Anopheles maculatus TaxID=74869 RepID=A0A182T0U0_9DIPT